MKTLLLPVVLGILFSGVLAANHYDPMVAFVCNKGAMHMDPDKGWYSDPNTDCLESKDNILEYCKSVYPSLDITNIVETSDHEAINGWCPVGRSGCSAPETFKVRPYRCLTGPFQTDALIVPSKCKFDHVHDSDQCQSYDWWGDVAQKTCSQIYSLQRRSFAMLLPCGTDMFTGVEFVCCPVDAVEPEKSVVDEPTPHIEVKVQAPERKDKTENTEPSENLVQKYLHLASSSAVAEFDNEHDLYELAKKQLLKDNHDKITKLMKEWSEARERVQQMKETDPKRAEKVNTEITDRYQKEYFSLQTEGDSKSLQLDAVHQQHVQSNFNYKKRNVMQRLMDQLQAQYYDMEEILDLLQKYIAIEEKDAHHCMKHFLKIRSRDPQAAQEMLPATVEHLTLISTRINQSVDLLDTLKDRSVADKMKLSIRSWLDKNYANLEKTISQFKNLSAPKPQVRPEPVIYSTPESSTESQESSSEEQDTNMYKVYAQKLSESAFVRDSKVEIASLQEEEDKEDEHKPTLGDSYKRNDIEAEIQAMSDARTGGLHGNMSAGALIAIACSMVGAMAVVVVAVLLVKKRNGRTSGSKSHNYLQVACDVPDQVLSPEDRHIAAMQHGYENPTYKLLEQRKA